MVLGGGVFDMYFLKFWIVSLSMYCIDWNDYPVMSSDKLFLCVVEYWQNIWSVDA